jgi:hypothetical protein
MKKPITKIEEKKETFMEPVEAIEPTVEPAPEVMPIHEANPEPVAAAPVVNMSFVDEVIALQQKLDSQRKAAIDQLLAEQKRIKEQLYLLGFEEAHSLPPTRVTRPAPQRRAPASVGSAPAAPRPSATGTGPFCKYCNASGHDARAHRGQAVKKAFTQSELTALNL